MINIGFIVPTILRLPGYVVAATFLLINIGFIAPTSLRLPGYVAGAAFFLINIGIIAPTILHLMGLPVLDDMDGRVLTEALTISRPVERSAADPHATGTEEGFAADDSAEVEERLRALGYLG